MVPNLVGRGTFSRVHQLTATEDVVDLDVAHVVRRDALGQIPVDDHDVGELAGLEGTTVGFLTEQARSVDGVHPQGGFEVDRRGG